MSRFRQAGERPGELTAYPCSHPRAARGAAARTVLTGAGLNLGYFWEVATEEGLAATALAGQEIED